MSDTKALLEAMDGTLFDVRSGWLHKRFEGGAQVAIDKLLVEFEQARAALEAAEEALMKCAVPYEALLLDHESRRWIAPTVWQHIEDAVRVARAVLRGNL